MDYSPTSLIFDDLLEINAWAKPHWAARLSLIEQEKWNLNALNQAGNQATRRWLDAFLFDRSKATLERLQGGDHVAWNAAVYEAVVPVLQSPEFAHLHPGTPMIPVSGGALVNLSERIEGYARSQFLADVLMLGQASLHEVRLREPLDLSGLSFTVGFRVYGGELSHVEMQEARFGPFSDVITRFGLCDATGAEFYGNISFTTSRFMGDARFPSASFLSGCSFSAVQFDKASDFTGAAFEWDTQFAGTVFSETAIFDDAVFSGRTTFEASNFHASASFSGARFPGDVYVGQIPDDVKAAILAADHG